MLAGVLLIANGVEGGPSRSAPRYAFGTLQSMEGHAREEAHAGVSVAMVEWSWAALEPRPGQFDETYGAQMQARVRAMRSAGRRVTLGLGLHDPPDWVSALPDSRMVDQHGRQSSAVDLVFNEKLRVLADGYLRKVASLVDLRAVWAVRITAGGTEEVVYPGGGSYWAFSSSAQNGASMPRSMRRNPAPGWRPGEPHLPTSQVRAWAEWYIDALGDVALWQMHTLASLRFRGWYQMVTPGVGVSLRQFGHAVMAHLPDGLVGVGAVWPIFYAHLPSRSDIVAYVSSMGDLSGGDGGCRPGDDRVSLNDPVTESWSAARWISRLADARHFKKNGENPGWHNPASLDDHYRDPSPRGMMAAAVKQMQSCHFQGMNWAHDQQLWDGTSPFARYAAYVAAAN